MNSLSGLTDLLKILGSHFQNRDKKSCQMYNALQNTTGLHFYTEEGSLLNPQTSHLSISVLNQSLGFNQRAPLLNAALSVMGYRASDICDTTTSLLVNALISVLLSTISCKVLSQDSCSAIKTGENYENASLSLLGLTGQAHMPAIMVDAIFKQRHGLLYMEEFLQIGTLISVNEFPKIVEACESIFRNTEDYGDLPTVLIDALLRVATSISSFKGHLPSSFTYYTKLRKEKTHALPKLLNTFVKRKELTDWNFISSSRLLAWRLEPHLLKQDISSLLREALQRPLLSLKHELYQKEAWHSIVMSLATAPEIFVEARRLLHNWFLQTGADRVLEVRFELVSAMLDALIKQSSWGMPIEAGLKLPCSYAFFCQKLQPLLLILMGPLSYGNLLALVHLLEEMQSSQVLGSSMYFKEGIFESSHSSAVGGILLRENPSEKCSLVDHDSVWALLLDFPSWFQFAAMLLFQPEASGKSQAEHGMEDYDTDRVHSNDTVRAVDIWKSCNSDRFQTAAKYLGWVLSPVEVTHRTMVIRSLIETSRHWIFWRSKLITCLQERKRVKEETNNQHNSLVWDHKVRVNRKRIPFTSENETGEPDVKYKKARVEVIQKNVHQSVLDADCSEESAHAVMQWLADFRHSCNKLCIDTVTIDLANKKQGIGNTAQNCKESSESQTLWKEEITAGLPQQSPPDTFLKQYAFLRRIPLGLFLANSHLLDEHACQMLLHFAATDKGLAMTPGSDDSIHHATKKGLWVNLQVGQVARTLNGSDDQEMYVHAREPSHQTENFQDSYTIDHPIEGKTNWVRSAAVILNFLHMIDMLHHTFESMNGSPGLLGQVKAKVGRFLVICIKQIVESHDLQELRLLKDLRCRFVDCTQVGETGTKEGETVFDETDVYHDILLALDSRISFLEAKR